MQALACVAALAWIVSLLLPALGARGGPTLSGFEVLLQGPGSLRYGIVAWLGNPLLLLSLVAAVRDRPRTTLALAAIGLLAGFSSFWTAELAAAQGRQVPELSFHSGFYLWMAAHLAAVGSGLIGVMPGGQRTR